MSRKSPQSFSSTSKLMDHIADPAQGKSRGQGLRDSLNVRSKIYENSKQPARYPGDPNMKTLKVRSNYARSRTVVLDSLVLKFDDHGEASFPAHQLPMLEHEMAIKPGRYQLVADEAPTVVVSQTQVVGTPDASTSSREDIFAALERIADKLKDFSIVQDDSPMDLEDDEWDLPIEEMEN